MDKTLSLVQQMDWHVGTTLKRSADAPYFCSAVALKGSDEGVEAYRAAGLRAKFLVIV